MIITKSTSSDTSSPSATHTPTLKVSKSISPASTRSLSISKSPSISIADDQGEVKSVFAADTGNETAPPENNSFPSLSFRNVWIMIIVLITAIILVWYRATQKKRNYNLKTPIHL